MPTPHPHGRLFVLDGNNIAYRAFFALPEGIATSTGFPTNALYGFCAMMIKILSDYRPDGVIVAWDSKQKTFRHEEFEAYKAQRKPMPDLLVEQWPFFVELAEAFGFVNLAAPGFEADDIIATLARQADAEGRELVIVTGDRDALQLVTEHVSVMSNTRGITEVKMYDPAAVVERFGVVPRLIPDLIGLKGDTSDNIPGVPGIGEKTAAQLLAEFGSLEEVLAGVDRVKGPKRQELLREHAETARLSKRLAILDHDAPIEIHKAEVTPHQVDRERLRELFGRFEFASLLDRLVEVLPTEDDLVSGPAPAEATELQVRDLDLRGLEASMDWSLPVGLAARTSEGRDQVWLAQAPAGRGRPGGNAAEQGTPSVYALSDLSSVGGPLRELLRRGTRYCHDLKRATALAGLLDRADHDTYLAAYLLAPGRRSYDLFELAAQAGLQAVRAEGPHAGAAEAATVLALASFQERLLRELGMWGLFQEIELPLTRVLIDMEGAGIHLDCYRLGEITAK
ncbi:MAG: DNA polymerase I, partial [Thermoleophilia bacterium]|nr:DNA polymerase I [Thermoleophilia bacterium]